MLFKNVDVIIKWQFFYNDIGLWSDVNVVSYNTFGGYCKHKGRSSFETEFDSSREGLGGNGRLDLQFLALVAPHRRNSTVSKLSNSSVLLLSEMFLPLKFDMDRWDYVQDGRKTYKDMNTLVAFYKGLTTWARWVNLNVNPAKTKVFFQGISPTHFE